MTSSLALAQPQAGVEPSPPAEESYKAESRPSSARQFPEYLRGLPSVIQAPTETAEIGALIRESLKPLTELARHGIRVELSLPPSAVRVHAGWLTANEVLRILARRVLENVYEGGVLSIDARPVGDRIIVEMAHREGTVTATSPDVYPSPAEDPRFRRVRALLAGIGGAFMLERQESGGLSVWIALAVAQA
ncbi:MAG TPA: hypothetical protein VN461_21420 [Vicinamibacteria bacterium]|jgi:hypothetical protein|nr:hypothetical protein [Vicinamibacteria bacterium]